MSTAIRESSSLLARLTVPPINHRCAECGFDRPRQGHRENCSAGTRDAANTAYRNGACTICHERGHRPGSPQCEECFLASRCSA